MEFDDRTLELYSRLYEAGREEVLSLETSLRKLTDDPSYCEGALERVMSAMREPGNVEDALKRVLYLLLPRRAEEQRQIVYLFGPLDPASRKSEGAAGFRIWLLLHKSESGANQSLGQKQSSVPAAAMLDCRRKLAAAIQALETGRKEVRDLLDSGRIDEGRYINMIKPIDEELYLKKLELDTLSS